jgi:acetylornithine/N-succinyldiaminopimelate aminotransferase
MAKAMGGGLPLGAFASSDVIFEAFKYDPPLNHVTTFGGHPVSCAASHAALSVLLSENLMSRAAVIESTVRETLKHPAIKEIRGKGAMLGVQLHTYEQTKRVVEACFKRGILLGWTLHSNTLIRVAPPLVISDDELQETLNEILKVVDQVGLVY